MEQAGRSKIHKAYTNWNCRGAESRWVKSLMNCSYIAPPDVQKFHEKKFMKTFSWCLDPVKLKTEQKLIILPCPNSPPYLFWRKIGTQSHSAKFLNWGDHVNPVPDLAASPPCMWYSPRNLPTALKHSGYWLITHCLSFSRVITSLKLYRCRVW